MQGTRRRGGDLHREEGGLKGAASTRSVHSLRPSTQDAAVLPSPLPSSPDKNELLKPLELLVLAPRTLNGRLRLTSHREGEVWETTFTLARPARGESLFFRPSSE